MPATAAKLSTEPADPPADAQLEHEAADADVARLTKAINDLRKMGPGADSVLLGALRAELEGALKVLRRADLEAAETVAAAGAPISARVIDKIRHRRRKVEGRHADVIARTGECQNLRERAGGLKSQIAMLKDSWAFRQDQQEIRSEHVFSHNPEAQDRPAPAHGTKKTKKSMLELAGLERSLETTAAELQIVVAAQVAASTRWESEKAVLDGWEDAVRRQGPAARAVLAAMPRPGVETFMPSSQNDFRLGIPGQTSPLIRG